MESRIVWLHTLSSLHIGAGDATDVIDLPVVRETVTNWPYIPASAIKGVFRDVCEEIEEAEKVNLITEAFGPSRSSNETDSALDSAGSLWFADARLLCFPVRSLHGTFAWLTCPYALLRFSRDLEVACLPMLPSVTSPAEYDQIVLSKSSLVQDRSKVYLEDLDLSVSADAEATDLAKHLAKLLFDDTWSGEFIGRFGVVSDDVFTFLVETCTQISAHIKIKDDTKTVQDGALWYEESVPPEAIFTMPLTAAPRKAGSTSEKLLGLVAGATKTPIQIGGKASVGRGIVRALLTGKG